MKRPQVTPQTREAALCDALRASGELTTLLTLALAELRNAAIDEQARRNSVSILTRKAYQMAVRIQHLTVGIP